MKKFIAAFAAVSMLVSALPTAMAAQEKKSVISYDFEKADTTIELKGGAALGEGKTGQGLVLDGKDGYALLPQNITSEKMTISSWVKLSRLNTWGRLFDFGEGQSNNFFFAPYAGGASRVELNVNGNVDTMDAADETKRDTWVHYAVTIGDKTISLYRNGVLVKTKTGISQDVSKLANTLNYIGKSHYDGDAYLQGTVDDFRIYDSVLSEAEIKEIMCESVRKEDLSELAQSYAIEDGQLVFGDVIKLDNWSVGDTKVEWSCDAPDVIDTKTGTVNHPAEPQTVKLTQTVTAGGESLETEYTVYVTGENEAPYTIDIDAGDRSKDVSDIMWGLFFEDINSAADGGLYAEMVQNGSFEFDENMYSWETEGDVEINTEKPMNENNPTYITMGANSTIVNDGFGAISLKAGEKYDFSMFVRGEGELSVFAGHGAETILNSDNADEWHKITATITAQQTNENTILIIKNNGDKPVDVDFISLMPQDTYKGHGLRKDLMEKLEEMHPKFLRFPGGCAVEGRTMDLAWNWKDTVGDRSERKSMENIWNPSATEPYIMSYGLGFYEYFQMCEDLGMEPVPILNCGMACQVRSNSATDEEHLVPMDKLQPYIDDAIDLIEFANGTDETNEWVQLRIKMGHKEPFNMKYIGIGNEQYGEIYFERYAEFAKQIHEKYPELNLVTTSGTASSGNGNDLAWNWANENDELADRMDEHYYETADWFRQHAYRYDNYRRDTNTKVFLGEYASKGNTWYNALSEAAFMIGLERNADVVRMASYAPMFAKYGNTQWTAANMIWFNNEEYVLTPNYYVQSLFSNNRGDYSLPTSVKLNVYDNDDTLHGGFVLGSWGTHNEFKDIEVLTKDTAKSIDVSQDLEKSGFTVGNGDWSADKNGVISQMSDMTGSVCAYNLDMDNYTLSLKAKKLSGGEGFQIGVAAEDGLSYYRVNIGGWGNTTAKIQHIVDGVSVDTGNVAEQSYVGSVHINDNEWYDVKVEVSDYEIKAYLNGEFICSYTKPKLYGPVYSSSVYDEKTGDVIVKIANTADADTRININLDNAGYVYDAAKTIIMSGDDNAENSLENKNNIVPVEGEINGVSDKFEYTAKANSFTVLRIASADVVLSRNDENTIIKAYKDGVYTVVASKYDEGGKLIGVDINNAELKNGEEYTVTSGKTYVYKDGRIYN